MSPDVADDFDLFIERAWADHGERPADVADRLAAAVDAVDRDAQAQPLARLIVHVCGEHLGDTQRGVAMLGALQSRLTTQDARDATARAVAVLRFAAGDNAVVERLPGDQRGLVLAQAAAVLAGCGHFGRAIDAYAAAQAAAGNLALAAPLERALAVAGNNLAAALEERQDRAPAETQAMVAAARAALAHWLKAGGWLEHERAEYRLGSALLQAGEPGAAAAAAQRCLDVCMAHDAPAIECFFAWALLARAHDAAGDSARARAAVVAARAQHADIAAGERAGCADEVAALDLVR